MQKDLFKKTHLKARAPVRYTGSKYRAAKHIVPYIDKTDFNEYREPFLGSGAIFFVQPLNKDIWLNDIDSELIETFKVMADPKKRKKLMERVSDVKPTKDFFDKLKYTKPTNSDDIAFRYFVINRTAYGGIMNKPNWGFHPIKSVQPKNWPDLIEKAGEKLENVTKITSLDFSEVIKAPSKNKVLMFIDPPYFAADQKRAYSYSFRIEDHLNLAKLLKETKHKFCLTYDNCNEIKELYSWANINEVEWMYNTANSNKTTRKKGKELIITNY